MFWFIGSINEAIAKSKTDRKLFVVFINGNDDISRKMNSLYESLSSKLSDLPIVAIKLESESDNCKLFSQIYPVILIPSTYFIDLNGVVIEIIGGSVEEQNVLLEKMNKTIETFKSNLSSNKSLNISESANNQKTTNTSNISQTSPPNESIANTSNPSISAVPSVPSTASVSTPNAVPEEESMDAKVDRANRLIEAIREKKAKEEAEREKLEEIERRKGMKEMQNSKKIREDMEAKEVIKEREREKREERLAKERVLAQIAADREERRARQMAFTEQKDVDRKEVTGEGSSTQASDVRQRVNHERARIQFRLPDGSTRFNVFESSDSLQSVRQYVKSNTSFKDFVLSTTFPRREFTPNDDNQTLRELSLSPSSVLLVIPKTGSNISRAVTSPNLLWQLLSYVLNPFLMVWNLITGFFGSSNGSNESSESTQSMAANVGQKSNSKKFYSKDGNVARIRDPNDADDDDNSTYNGNSTQQM